MNIKNIAVVGGDKRMKYTGEYFSRYKCRVRRIKSIDSTENTDFLKKTDLIILPLPMSRDGVYLTGEWGEIKVADILDIAPKEALIVGGVVKDFDKITDYYEREELQVKNAVPTAEGAIATAILNTDINLQGANCLVIGYGRIGKVVADLLKAFGAKTTVSARRDSDIAWIQAKGFESVKTGELQDIVSKFDIIFSTVPVLILNSKVLDKLQKHTLIIDLASAPGSVDFESAEFYKLNCIKAMSLPGKISPKSAGLVIGETVVKIATERGYDFE